MHEKLQLGLDALVGAPQWAGYSLLALAALITVLGRHGQRPLNAALLAGAVVALALTGLRGAVHAWVPGVAAVICGALAAFFGLVATAWGTASVMAVILGGAGARAEAKRVLKSKDVSAAAKMEAGDLIDRTEIDHGPIATAVAFVILLGLMLMYLATSGK